MYLNLNIVLVGGMFHQLKYHAISKCACNSQKVNSRIQLAAANTTLCIDFTTTDSNSINSYQHRLILSKDVYNKKWQQTYGSISAQFSFYLTDVAVLWNVRCWLLISQSQHQTTKSYKLAV